MLQKQEAKNQGKFKNTVKIANEILGKLTAIIYWEINYRIFGMCAVILKPNIILLKCFNMCKNYNNKNIAFFFQKQFIYRNITFFSLINIPPVITSVARSSPWGNKYSDPIITKIEQIFYYVSTFGFKLLRVVNKIHM